MAHTNPSSFACKTSDAGLTIRGARVTQVKLNQVVRNYLYRIFEKLGVSTRVELVPYCLQDRQRVPKSLKVAEP